MSFIFSNHPLYKPRRSPEYHGHYTFGEPRFRSGQRVYINNSTEKFFIADVTAHISEVGQEVNLYWIEDLFFPVYEDQISV